MAKKVKKAKGAKQAQVRTVRAVATVSIETEGLPKESVGKLPRGTVTLKGEDSLAINVEKLSNRLVRDQRAKMVSSMGCVSNPGGPGC